MAFETSFREFVRSSLPASTVHVGPNCKHETIESALDETSGAVALHLSPEWSTESAVVVDVDAPVSLVGRSVTSTVVPGLTIKGRGPAHYGAPITVANLSVDGTLSLLDAPQTTVSDVVTTGDGHGVHVVSGSSEWGSYGLRCKNVFAVNNRGDGFRIDGRAHAHSSHFVDCLAQANRGAGYRLRNYKQSIRGGTVQLNHGPGVDVRGPACSIKDCYIEGNGRAADWPVEIYADGAHGLSLRDNYCHAINPRGASHEHKYVQNILSVHDSRSVLLDHTGHRKYGDGVYRSFNSDVVERDSYPL